AADESRCARDEYRIRHEVPLARRECHASGTLAHFERLLLARRRADVVRGRTDDAVVLALFHDMSQPAEDARCREAGGEINLGNSEGEINDAFVEFQIGAQRSTASGRLFYEFFFYRGQRFEE